MHSNSHEQVEALQDSDLEQVNTDILVTMDQQKFYKNSDSLKAAQREFHCSYNLGHHGGLITLKRLDLH